MAFKLVIFVACLAVARAGVPVGYAAAPHHYSDATQVSYSSISNRSPVIHAAPVAQIAAPAYQTYSAPAVHSYAQPAYKTYATPVVSKVATYSAPSYQTYAQPAVHSYAAPAYQSYAAPVVAKVAAPAYAKTVYAEPEAPAHYDFGYSVNDIHTGDIKSQHESRNGDQVHGSYSLVEADGTKRTVEYTADDHNGFNAVVHREQGHAIVKAPVVAKVASPVAYAAPTFAKIAAPAYSNYAAPSIAKVAGPAYTSYSAPALAKVAAPVYNTYSSPALAAPAYNTYSSPALAAPAYNTYAHGGQQYYHH